MDFGKTIRDIGKLGLNLYDFALYTGDGIQTHRFQPCANCSNSYSIAKVFVMTAVGMLCDDGLLKVTDRLYPVFKEQFPEKMDRGWRFAAVEDAMTHRLGFKNSFWI